MIADFLTVKREWAPLIDLALGDWAQRFVVRDIQELLQALAQKPEPFRGPGQLSAAAGSSSLRPNRRRPIPPCAAIAWWKSPC